MTGKRRAGRGSSPASPSPSASFPPPVIGSRPPTRRELRAERRRQRRRRLGAGGIAGVVVVVLAVLAGGGFFVQRATSGSDKPTDAQQTMLVSLQAGDRSADATMLVAHQTSPRESFEMLVPSRLLTDVCGYGSEAFGQVLALPDGANVARTTLSQILGAVTIDSTLTIGEAQFAKLVDAVGGVTVDVDTDVITNSGGARVVAIPKGSGQHLNGSQAVQFATYVGQGEDPTASLSRFQSVFEAVITSAPSAAKLTRALQTAGLDAATSSRAGSLFASVAADDKGNRLLAEQLPTQPIDAGGGTPSYRVDQGAVKSLVSSQLAKSMPADDVSKRPTVLIQNGVGTSGLVLTACNRLLPAGFMFAGSGNAQSFNYATSQVFVFPNGQDDLVRVTRIGNRVASLLRLPASDVVASMQGNNVASVVVILGRDYKP